MSEFQVLNTLQQMTMASNAYKTQTGTSDRSVAELVIAGFSGQLKGWWDYHLTVQQQTDILYACANFLAILAPLVGWLSLKAFLWLVLLVLVLSFAGFT